MRSIWKGAISFGLVTIPVKVYSATEQRDVAFHQVHRTDAGRIRYRRICSVCGEDVPFADIAKGFELPGGEIVVLTDEDFADLPLTTSRRIEVLQFVPLEQLDPIYFAKSYYLEPEGLGSKAYVLLRDALQESGKVALVKVALRQRESLATLRARDGVFVLETMLWPDEVRTPEFPFLEEKIEVRPQELTMASSLIETMAGDFEPAEYKDAYREALQAVIDAKIEGREVAPAPEAVGAEAAATDLLAALRASVEAAKKGRAEGEGATRRPAARKPSADKPETKAGAKSGTGTGARTAARTGAKAGAKTGARTGDDAAAKAEGKAAAKAAAKPAAKAAEEPADKPAARSRRSA